MRVLPAAHPCVAVTPMEATRMADKSFFTTNLHIVGEQNSSASDSIQLATHICFQETEPSDALCHLNIISRLPGLYFYDRSAYFFDKLPVQVNL